jgi:hypothetical protein
MNVKITATKRPGVGTVISPTPDGKAAAEEGAATPRPCDRLAKDARPAAQAEEAGNQESRAEGQEAESTVCAAYWAY